MRTRSTSVDCGERPFDAAGAIRAAHVGHVEIHLVTIARDAVRNQVDEVRIVAERQLQRVRGGHECGSRCSHDCSHDVLSSGAALSLRTSGPDA